MRTAWLVTFFSAFIAAFGLRADALPFNCGALGYTCVNGRDCVNSVCTPAWQTITTTNAPAARGFAAAAPLGGSYVVSGGCNGDGALDSTAAYNPLLNTWVALPPLDQARAQHSAVSNNHGTFVYGGISVCNSGSDDGPALEQLTALNVLSWHTVNVHGDNDPGAVYNTALSANADEIFLYGGGNRWVPAVDGGASLDFSSQALWYLLVTPDWSWMGCTLSDCQRGGPYHTFIDGSYMRVWGGGAFGNAPDGLKMLVSNHTWSAWTVPSGTPDFTTVASSTGSGQLRFGDDGRRIYYINEGGGDVMIYDRQGGGTWSEDTTSLPTGLCTDGAVAWVGSELISWGGYCGGSYSTVGARYQPPAP